MYYKSVGRNSILILGLTPDNTGLLQKGDAQRLAEFGNEISRRFLRPLAGTQGKGKAVTIKLTKMESVTQIVIGENISKVERIRKYKVEAKLNNGWQTVCSGTSVGNKRIQTFNRIKTKAIRLVVEEFIDEPIVDSFKIYDVQL